MLNYHFYDTQVIAKSTIRSIDVACRQLENCVASVQQWCASRRLQLKADKTELIWFGSAAHLVSTLRLSTVYVTSAWPDLWCPGGHDPGPPTSRGPSPKLYFCLYSI